MIRSMYNSPVTIVEALGGEPQAVLIETSNNRRHKALVQELKADEGKQEIYEAIRNLPSDKRHQDWNRRLVRRAQATG